MAEKGNAETGFPTSTFLAGVRRCLSFSTTLTFCPPSGACNRRRRWRSLVALARLLHCGDRIDLEPECSGLVRSMSGLERVSVPLHLRRPAMMRSLLSLRCPCCCSFWPVHAQEWMRRCLCAAPLWTALCPLPPPSPFLPLLCSTSAPPTSPCPPACSPSPPSTTATWTG